MSCSRVTPSCLAALMLAGCSESAAPDDQPLPIRPPEVARILPAEDALAGANISALDPTTMNDAEIRKVLGPGPYCAFRYTVSGKPVLVVANSPTAGRSTGALKLNGSLVRLQLANDAANGAAATLNLSAGPVHASLMPLAANQLDERASENRDMTLILEIKSRIEVGYRGYFSCKAPPASAVAEAPNETVQEGAATTEPTENAGDDVARTLPNGSELRIARTGVEAELLAFLEGDAKPTAWFDLDSVTFGKGESEAPATSSEQLRNLAKILIAYPKATATIGGHTDNLGGERANRRLSHARAMSIVRELRQMGVSSSQLRAKGYGGDRPVASNDTKEGRAKNRRISVEVIRDSERSAATG